MVNFRQLAENVPGGTWLDDLARASALAAHAKFERTSRSPLLRVSVLGSSHLDAYTSSDLSRALQDATAKIGHIVRNPQTEITSVQPSDREKAPLIQRGQAGNAMFFGFPETSVPGALISDGIETLSERAVKELCDFLPVNGSDDGALDAVLLQRDTVRNAVSDVVNAVMRTSSIALSLTPTTGEDVARSMTTEQARVLQSSLRESREDVGYETVTGRLDGVRTRRRIFYLERDTGSTIQGAVAPDLLDKIKENLDRPVTARLRVVRTTTIDGRRGRPVYELLEIRSETSLFD
ncbi:hypothetical protein ACWGRK_05450 [Saccharomonospora azurea]|uniref:Uncharacterized protein n=1 Tax=Saccharomonospora azurea NA-128 TaxID=882081 RepID=H8G4Q0_9PSEU|nr:hypothetical protein [Saccharomonospora azurea]EHK87407.1 hypothetical protein SZMC14600_10718 [Saccharomonospora azurea SZMC 14600]EHY89153.1 hypothetical protein SacazDRAFT_02242 [Saccharomonospora azurea NA-128]